MMANHKFNKGNSSSVKRSSFLSDDVMKEFGNFKKKPKLDIVLTPPIVRSPNKTVVNTNKDLVDELWGEDLPEDTIEECVLLATQACQEESIVKTDLSIHKRADIIIQSNASSSRNVPNEFSKPSSSHIALRGSTSIAFQSTKEVAKPRPIISVPTKRNLDQNKNGISGGVLEIGKKLECENKELKEKCLQKEGEVAILRSQLQKLELQLKTVSLDHSKSLEAQAQKFTKQIKDQKKELDVTTTQLQFQIMESTSIRNHCKVLEGGSKIKFIEPQSPRASTHKRKREEQKPQSSTSLGSRSKPNTESNNQIVKLSILYPTSSIREGSVLGQLVNQYLTIKSEQDISWILYLRKKQCHCRKIKEAEGLNKKILALQKSNVTLENCYAPINKLITLDAVSSSSACFHVETIVRECQRIVCRQMHILCLISGVQSYTERRNLNGVVSLEIGKSATNSECELMKSEKWFDEEEGIESRRALGLLCALCNVSSLACDLTFGSENMSSDDNIRDIVGETSNGIVRSAATLNKFCIKGNQKISDKITSESQKNDEMPYNEYLMKPFGFLRLLSDIIFAICYQRRTKHFTGFLTGCLKLLSAIGRNTTLVEGGLKLVSEIIRDVAFCRPQTEVINALFELLSRMAIYPFVMKSLCVNSDDKTFVDNKDIGLVYFTRESCVCQVLFRLLPTSTTTVQLRTDLAYHMVHWLYTMVCFSGKEQCWLLAIQEQEQSKCSCKATLASGLVTTMYNTLCDLDAVGLDPEIRWRVLETCKKSIVLLRLWQSDKRSWAYFDYHNLSYQLWLSRIEMDLPKLNLNDLERECLNELLEKPEKGNDTNTEVEDEIDVFWNILSKDCKTLLAEHR